MSASTDFRKLIASLPALESKLLNVLEIEAENFVAANFDDGGFNDGGLQPWKPRKKEAKIPYAPLVKTGDLKRSATTATRRGKSIAFVMNQPYAQVHNEGGKAGRGAGFQMPKRQFIGRSKTLESLFEIAAKKQISNHIKSL